MHNTEGKMRNIEQKQAAALQRKPARREEKGDPQAGQRGRLFAAGISVAACFFCSARLRTAVLVYHLSGCVSVDFRRELVCGGAKRRRTRL